MGFGNASFCLFHTFRLLVYPFTLRVTGIVITGRRKPFRPINITLWGQKRFLLPIYTLWGRKRFLLPVTYFPTNLVYPYSTSNGYTYKRQKEAFPTDKVYGRRKPFRPIKYNVWGQKRFLLPVIVGSETLPSACYTSIPFYSTSNGYNNKRTL